MKFYFYVALLCLNLVIAQKATAFPEILDWIRSPIVVFDNKKEVVLQKKLLLKSPFAVVTANDDQFKFKMNSFDYLVVYPKSKIQVLEFTDDTGFVSDLYILDGQLRFHSDFRSANKDVAAVTLKTPFFDLDTNFVADLIIDLNIKEPSVEVKVISGSVPLSFFAFEKSVVLNAGEKVKFNGHFASDGTGVVYDYLLNNRKAPKGELGAVQKFDQSGFEEIEKKIAEVEINRKKEIIKKQQDKIRKQIDYEKAFLCKKPYGKKDQCAWHMVDQKCFRQRCNVNAKWGDITERPISAKCKADFFVGPCDY